MADVPDFTCPVCKEGVAAARRRRPAECCHWHCRTCLTKSLATRQRCPVCNVHTTALVRFPCGKQESLSGRSDVDNERTAAVVYVALLASVVAALYLYAHGRVDSFATLCYLLVTVVFTVTLPILASGVGAYLGRNHHLMTTSDGSPVPRFSAELIVAVLSGVFDAFVASSVHSYFGVPTELCRASSGVSIFVHCASAGIWAACLP